MATQRLFTRRQQQKENTKRAILQSAYDLFAEKGYERTTMRALATRAGVGLGTIFKHFPDKPSLLVAAYRDDLDGIIQEAFASLPASGIKEQLLHLTARIFAFYSANPQFSRTLLRESLFLEGEHGAILDNQLQVFLEAVEALVGDAIHTGELAPTTDPFLGAQAYGSFYFAALVMGLKQPIFDVKAQVQLVGVMLNNHFFSKR